jgi:hypothetical protein
MTYSLIPIRQTTTQLLSGGALSFTYTMLKDGEFHWVGIKFGANVSETVSVTFNSADGSSYDILLDTATLSTASNYFYLPNGPVTLKAGDAITVTCTNATATTTAYLTAFFTQRPTWIN